MAFVVYKESTRNIGHWDREEEVVLVLGEVVVEKFWVPFVAMYIDTESHILPYS